MRYIPFNAKIGRKVHRYRKLRGFSQEELSLSVGINRSYLSRIEEGAANPTILLLYRIAYSLDLHISDLFKDL